MVRWFWPWSRKPAPKRKQPVRPAVRLCVERLEYRCVPAVLTVTSAANDGAGSLRATIAAAAPGDTINFAATLANQTITLTSTIATNFNLNIIGQSPAGANLNISISGNNAVQIFNFAQATSDTINNLNLVNGHSNVDGGAIYAGDSLVLNDDTFRNNTVPGTGGAIATWGSVTATNCNFITNAASLVGGAIWVNGGNVSLNGCSFNDNRAQAGGAVNADSIGGNTTFQILNCPSISGNTATGGNLGNGDGGAIYETGYNAVLANDTFTQNTAQNGNGGAFYANGSLQVTNCNFVGNSATAPFGNYAAQTGWGGAIFATGQLTVTSTQYNGSSFSNNIAVSGGAAIAYWPTSNSSSQMSLSNTTFVSNQGDFGGAVSDYVTTNQGTVTVTVNGCLFQNNTANRGGNMPYQGGGGINVSQTTSGTGTASFTVTNSTFYGNSAMNTGGGLFLASANTGTGTNQMTLTSLTVTQNGASGGGGGLRVSQTDPALLPQVGNCIIAGNSVMFGSGPDVSGAVLSRLFNLIGVDNGSSGWLPSDQLGNAAAPLNPGLAPAGPTNNGGFTNTVALAQGSPAYQHGNQSLAGTTDQRGRVRQSNAQLGLAVSVGAYDPDAQ